jgi:hypothetical protein
MPTALDINCHAVLLAASTAELGIVLTTNNPPKARACLYKFRRDFGDPSFAALHIRASPNDAAHEVWIIRRAAATASVDIPSLL